jgi:hypothetical protein
MKITPTYFNAPKRPYDLGYREIAEHWRDWGYGEDQHHCVLVAFFESWVPNSRHLFTDYPYLAKVLFEHYPGAAFPPDAKNNPFVFWLYGARRTPRHSHIASREEFDERYLKQFGPVFDVGIWLQQYRKDPEDAARRLMRLRAEEAKRVEEKDKKNKSRQGERTDLKPINFLYEEKIGIQEVAPTGTSSEAAHRRLRKDRPDLHERVLTGELTANAAMIEAGFRKARRYVPNQKSVLARLHRTWEQATEETCANFQTWVRNRETSFLR